ncbi:MAG: hypothetical protein AAF902_08825, partial [Chloroflexota bacterium]
HIIYQPLLAITDLLGREKITDFVGFILCLMLIMAVLVLSSIMNLVLKRLGYAAIQLRSNNTRGLNGRSLIGFLVGGSGSFLLIFVVRFWFGT